MHVIFIPYGKRDQVELLLRDMEAQKHELILTKGSKSKSLWIQGQVRVLPFGFYEYVFPKEDLDAVLYTLGFDADSYLSKAKLAILRKSVGAKKIPKFSKNFYYRWIRDHVGIIPIGIREDRAKTTDDSGEHKGWTHEAI